jgi:hypothetical protein
MAKQFALRSDWLYKDPVELDDIDRGEFTQDDDGTYHISAQNFDGVYWAPRTRINQESDAKPGDKHTWPPHNYNYNGAYGYDTLDTEMPDIHLVIRTLTIDTGITTAWKATVPGEIGDVVCDMNAKLIAPNHRSSKGILLPDPETKIDSSGPRGSQTSGKTFRVMFERMDPDGEHNGQSLLEDGQYYHITAGAYLQ